MIKARRLGHATFVTPDIERQIDYYQDVIGLSLVAREGNRAFLATEVGQLAVVLEKGAEARCARIAFEVAGDATIDDAAKELAARGLRPAAQSDPVPGVPNALTFTDPKGTTLELFSRWEFLNPQGAVAGARPNKLGHIAFVVADPKAMAEFYAATLGFRVSDWIEDWFVFMRCGMDHHTVNFVHGKRVDRLHHIAFELRDASHLTRALDLLGRNNVPISWGPVRHGPGHNIATYHRDPDGQLVELFIDLDEMADDVLEYYEPRPWHRDKPQRPKVWTGLPRDIWGMPPSPDFTRELQ